MLSLSIGIFVKKSFSHSLAFHFLQSLPSWLQWLTSRITYLIPYNVGESVLRQLSHPAIYWALVMVESPLHSKLCMLRKPFLKVFPHTNFQVNQLIYFLCYLFLVAAMLNSC